jgi:colicin import membrane protein
VFSDLEVVWDTTDIRPHSPDVTVVLGVRVRDRRWRSFSVAAEGVRPCLLIEVTSPSTRQNDLETKVAQYFRLGVPFYAIVDETTPWDPESRGLRLLGYRAGPNEYESLPLDDEGRLWLEPVGLWLAIEDDSPVCRTPDGRRLENFTELAESRDEAEAARDEAEAARDAEARARAEAEERIRQLEEELRRLRGGP